MPSWPTTESEPAALTLNLPPVERSWACATSMLISMDWPAGMRWIAESWILLVEILFLMPRNGTAWSLLGGQNESSQLYVAGPKLTTSRHLDLLHSRGIKDASGLEQANVVLAIVLDSGLYLRVADSLQCDIELALGDIS